MFEPLQQVDRTFVLHRGRRFIYFGGCDYFRMASHPAVLRAVKLGLSEYGLNVAASRVTTGHHRIYDRLERELARFFGVESALLASNGYAPNLMVAQALANRFSHVLLDEKAHGSLVDAAQFFACPVAQFRHCDADDLARTVDRLGPGIRPILLTDGMFSHDGGIAPLRDYRAVLPKNAVILVDDAHGAGVIGRTGRGTAQHCGVDSGNIIQTITLSKAFGVYGGAVLSDARLTNAIVAHSRLFTGNTPLPLPFAAGALESIRIVRRDKAMRQRLHSNTSLAKEKLRQAGHAINHTPAPIIALVPRNKRHTNRLQRRLDSAGVYSSLIRYPGGPASGYFRFAISSEHTPAQLNALIGSLIEEA